MRKLIAVLVLCLGGLLVILSYSEIQSIFVSLQHANLFYLVFGIVLQAVWFIVLGLTFRSLYRSLGLGEQLRSLALIAAASGFVSLVTPTAGVGGLAFFISEGQKRGLAPGKVTVASALFVLLDQMAFLFVLAIGIIILVRHKNLSPEEFLASLILLAIACVLALLLYLSYRAPIKLGKLLAKIARMGNRLLKVFTRREYFSETRALSFAMEMSEGLGSLPRKPYSLLAPFLFSLINKALLMGVLTSAFLSFNIPFTAGKIITSFSIAYLFVIVSPTPSGLGVVEGAMTLVLHSLHLNWGDAILVTLAYRAVTFWLVLAFGALAFRSLSMSSRPPQIEKAPAD